MTYDPSTGTVAQVNAYLDEHPDEAQEVLAAEATAKARVGILEGPHAAVEPIVTPEEQAAEDEAGAAHEPTPDGDEPDAEAVPFQEHVDGEENDATPLPSREDPTPPPSPEALAALSESPTSEVPLGDPDAPLTTPPLDESFSPVPLQEVSQAEHEATADADAEVPLSSPVLSVVDAGNMQDLDQHPLGFIGHSPGLEATGKADKGLSLPSVLARIHAAPEPTEV